MTKNSRVASEVFVAGNKVVIGGEVKSNHKLSKADYDNLVKDVLKNIGYDGAGHFSKEQCLHPDEVDVMVFLNEQSPDINQGVDQEDGETGAGDQGIMFGFASCEAEEYMPAAIIMQECYVIEFMLMQKQIHMNLEWILKLK